jgi:hypothetical protein
MNNWRLQLTAAALWITAGLIASFVTYVLPEAERGFDFAWVVFSAIALGCYASGVSFAVMAIIKTGDREFSK